MANQRDLKAFVRYDGSGRVVAGSLVLRKKKPKVGRWEEILTYECCGDSPTTTTTSTFSTTTTTTTTVVTPSFFYLVSDTTDSTNACNLIGETTYMTLGAVESDINNITVLYQSPSSGVFIPFVGNGDKYLVAVPGGGPNPPTNYTSMNINNNGFVSNKSTC